MVICWDYTITQIKLIKSKRWAYKASPDYEKWMGVLDYGHARIIKYSPFLKYQSTQENSWLTRIFLPYNYFSVWVHRENTFSTQVFCSFFLILYILLLFDCIFITALFSTVLDWVLLSCNSMNKGLSFLFLEVFCLLIQIQEFQ